ncbi:hypothetical protein ACO0R3_003408 [Hanseniaspora guilliermondii]
MSSYTYLDCYGSLPSSFSFYDSYDFQSPGWCSTQCTNADSNNKYFALFNHSDCYCSSEYIDFSSVSTSSSCTAYCFGYSSEMCGGTSDAYSIYEFDDAISSSSSSASGSSSSSSASSTSSVGSSISVTTLSKSSSSSSSESSSTSDSSTSSESSTSSTASSNIERATTVTSLVTSQIVYSTDSNNSGTSQIVVTEVVSTVISTATKEVVQSSSSDNHHKSNKHIGPIVGGVVGGVAGLLILAFLALLLAKKISKKREAERLEREYQEAIKPRAFGLTSAGMIANEDIEKSYPDTSSGGERHSGLSNDSNRNTSPNRIASVNAAMGTAATSSNNRADEDKFNRPNMLGNSMKHNRISEYDINKEFEGGYVDQQMNKNGNPFADKHETTSDLNYNPDNGHSSAHEDQDGEEHAYSYSEDDDGSDGFIDFDANNRSQNNDDLDEDSDFENSSDNEGTGNGLTVANPDSD